MGNFGFQTPPRVDSPHEHPNAPTHERLLNSEQLVSPWNFDPSPVFCTIPSIDPFESSNASTPVRRIEKPSLDNALDEIQSSLQTTSMHSLSSRSPSPTTAPLQNSFTNPLYNIYIPSTWPTVYLPYHTTPGLSTPTQISEMLCHVHYKGAGAMALHDLLVAEMQAAQTEEDKDGIEFSAYLSWPHNCTRDGWRVYSGMTAEEEEMWREDVRWYREGWMGMDSWDGGQGDGEEGWGEQNELDRYGWGTMSDGEDLGEQEDLREQEEMYGMEEILGKFGLEEECSWGFGMGEENGDEGLMEEMDGEVRGGEHWRE